MSMPDDINNFSDLTGVNSETTNTIIPEIEINNPLIFTPSTESFSVPITQLNDLDNIILPENLPIYEPTVDISTDESVDTLTGEAIRQAINQAVIEGYQYLQGFAATPEFEAKMDLAFGENWDKEANISLPQIAVISSTEINGAFAEATDTVYLSKEFLAQNLENIGEVTDVWLEEFGHSIDSQINIVDTQGDEGEIFSAVVQGKDLSEVDIEALKGENDKAFVEIDGEILKIEKDDSFDTAWDIGTLSGTKGLNDYFSNGDANDYSRFYLPNRSNVNITLSGLSEDIDLQLLRDDGSFVNESILGYDSDELISEVLDAGTYYVRVYPAYGDANSNYSLSLSADPISEVNTQSVETNLGQVNTNPVGQMRPYVLGSLGYADDTLWDIAESQLGNGSRWTEIRKPDGSTYTEEEARSIQPLTTVYLPADGTQTYSEPVETNLGQVNTNPVGQMRPYVLGSLGYADDTLWDIAESQLGNGSRWTEIRKPDGSTYTEEEARSIQPLTTVYLPADGTQTYSEPVETNLGQVNTNPVGQMRPYVLGSLGYADDTLWDIAESQLGNGSRWTEIRKSDGSTYTEEEAGSIQPLTTVYLPTDGTQTYSEPVNIGNNSTGATVGVTTGNNPEPTGGSSEVGNLGKIDGEVVERGLTVEYRGRIMDNLRGVPDLWPTEEWINVEDRSGEVTLYRYKEYGKTSQDIERGKDTILVIHGRGDSTNEGGKIDALAREAARLYEGLGYQVLALDWRESAADSEQPPVNAARFITPVAEWTKQTLDSLGIGSDNLTLFGHSLGSYVSSEIGRLFNGTVKNIVALDPATPGKNYDVNGNEEGLQSVWNFEDVAQRSLSLVAKDGSHTGGLAGSSTMAATADDSLVIKYEGHSIGYWNPFGGEFSDRPTEEHNSVIDVFRDALHEGFLTLESGFALPSDHWDNMYTKSGDWGNNLGGSFGYPQHEGRVTANINDGTIEKLDYVNGVSEIAFGYGTKQENTTWTWG